MKKLLSCITRFAAIAVWAVAGTALADDCTHPPQEVFFSRQPGNGVGGYDVVTGQIPAGSSTPVMQPKNPRGSMFAPFWSRNCDVPSGATTQWISFQMRASNFWSSGVVDHVPLFMQASFDSAPEWDFRGAGLAIYPAGDGAYTGVMFEDWIAAAKLKAEVKRGLDNFQFRDDVVYNVTVHVNTSATAVWIHDSGMKLLASKSTPALSARSMRGGYGFALLCAGKSHYGKFECEYSSGPLANTRFSIRFSAIKMGFF
jgi:hypothetical protein